MIDPRKTKAEVSHQTGPNKRMRCGICVNFAQPDACKAVKGPVGERGWCQLYRGQRQTIHLKPRKMVEGASSAADAANVSQP